MADAKTIKRNWRFKDLTGQRFGRLTVVEWSHTKATKPVWRCLCDCGTVTFVMAPALTRGLTKSCGCLRREVTAARSSIDNSTHRMTSTPEYEAWSSAKKNNAMCSEWVSSFESFYEHIGPRPTKDHSLSRLNNDQGYYPGNVKWATKAERAAKLPRPTITDLAGQRFGRWLVVSLDPIRSKTRGTRWLCRCDCGNESVVQAETLKGGRSQSCGCWNREISALQKTTHGLHRTPEYQAWSDAKQRCFNPQYKQFKDYGGRGITMCEEWQQSFAAFFAHIGPRPKGTTLERIDNDRHYEPGNVRWATRVEQAHNRRPKGRP